MEYKLITIIIPVYQVEPFIERCIRSVKEQTYTNWELLLIDDGSKDKSGIICDEYAKLDDRIRVFHTENKGRSEARNLGIKESNSGWIVFIDSDDFVGKRYLQSLVEGNPTWNIDTLSSVGHWGCKANGSIIKDYISGCYPYLEFTNTNGNKEISQNNLLHNQAVWGRLFSREILRNHNILFNPQINNCEDAIFIHTYMLYVHKFYFSKNQEYFYVLPEEYFESSKKKNINYPEILLLAESYEKLSLLLINHLHITDKRYRQRIIDFYQSRLSTLLFSKKCPTSIKRESARLSKTIIFKRPILNITDIKLLIKYIFK